MPEFVISSSKRFGYYELHHILVIISLYTEKAGQANDDNESQASFVLALSSPQMAHPALNLTNT